LQLSSTSTYHRLLDEETCTLDELVVPENNHPVTPQSNTEGLALDDIAKVVYWLCYDERDDVLSASRSKFPPSQPSSVTQVMRLTIRMRPLPSTEDTNHRSTGVDQNANHNNNKSTNVGTAVLFQDDAVRIWEFRLRPHEQCDYHVHRLRYFFTNVSWESETQELSEAGQMVGSPRRQVRGQTIYVGPNSLGSHAVLNVGSTTFLQFVVEFKE
jgi:beta-alanine degradation protein BauB